MEWEQLKAIGEVSSRNLLKQEVEEHIKMFSEVYCVRNHGPVRLACQN